MPRISWSLRRGQPCIEVVLALRPGGQHVTRVLLADTGAGSRHATFELILEEDDCLLCGGNPWQPVKLTGAYIGSFPVYHLRVRLPGLGFDGVLRVVGVPKISGGFEGIAGFRFLNRFSYGNFCDHDSFVPEA